MRLFDLFGKNRIEPLWEFTASGILWHVLAVDHRFLIGEERDPEAKQAAFFCLDPADGRLLWRETAFGNQWWIGIAGVFRGTLLLHGFASPDMPLPHGIIAVDIPTGKKLWDRPDLALRGVSGENLVGEKTSAEGGLFFEIALRGGETRGPIDPASAEPFPPPDSPTEFPMPLEEAIAENPELLRQVDPHISDRSKDSPVEVYFRHNRIAVSFHESRPESTPEAPHYQHVLQVIDTGQQRAIFKRILDADTTGLIPDPFFVFRDTLYCIRERKTLIAVPVAGSRDPNLSQ